MDENKNEFLLLHEDFIPLTIEEAEALKPIQKNFIQSYIANKDKMTVSEWLHMELKANLPERSDEEIRQISEEIIKTIETATEKQQSLSKAIANGRSKESWFASEIKTATSHLSTQESVKYLSDLDTALSSANEKLYSTILTQSGAVNRNPHLDGFIAEQYHAQTFNLNAEAVGSPYRAKVLQPEGQGYAKNSVDVVIVDGGGKVVRRYQSKYCKDAEKTLDAFGADYRGQRKLASADQVTDGVINGSDKKASIVLEAPDGTTSNPLTKTQAELMRDEAQSGKWNELNWNEYQTKDLAMGIGKQAGEAALMGAAIGVGFNIAQKVWNGEEVDAGEVFEAALNSGADFGIKAAAAGALKVGAEKGIIKLIPKGTPAGIIANTAFVAVENVKVIGKMATGELTVKEGFDKMGQTTVAAVAGIAASAEGASWGAAIGSVFGPAGTVVGGFIGGTVGYMAGSKVGETIVKGAQKIRDKAIDVVKSVGSTIASVGRSIASGISNLCSSLFS